MQPENPPESAPSANHCLSYWLATWFGAGLLPVAPGTWGTLAALPVAWVLGRTPVLIHVIAVVAVVAIGVWSSARLADRLEQCDPPIVVIDEVAGVLVALLLLRGQGVLVQGSSVILFRVLDIAKPWPISVTERWKPVGLGIMADDLVAGMAAALLAFSVGWWLGA